MTCELCLKESKPDHINAFNKTLSRLSIPCRICLLSLLTSCPLFLPFSLIVPQPLWLLYFLFLLQEAPSPGTSVNLLVLKSCFTKGSSMPRLVNIATYPQLSTRLPLIFYQISLHLIGSELHLFILLNIPGFPLKISLLKARVFICFVSCCVPSAPTCAFPIVGVLHRHSLEINSTLKCTDLSSHLL